MQYTSTLLHNSRRGKDLDTIFQLFGRACIIVTTTTRRGRDARWALQTYRTDVALQDGANHRGVQSTPELIPFRLMHNRGAAVPSRVFLLTVSTSYYTSETS
jgi:hypothetical protein